MCIRDSTTTMAAAKLISSKFLEAASPFSVLRSTTTKKIPPISVNKPSKVFSSISAKSAAGRKMNAMMQYAKI